MKFNLKAGYCLYVTSWENDGDDYSTQTIDGLNLEEAKCLQEIIPLFSSNKHFGNEEYDSLDHEWLFDLIAQIKSKYDDSLLGELFSFNQETMYDDFIIPVLGSPVGYDYGWVRVYENHSVFFNEKEINFSFEPEFIKI